MQYSIESNKDLYLSVQVASGRPREYLERKKSQTVISQKEKEN